MSWNTAELLDECLRALPAALGGVRAEVVVVDNASDDRSVAVARDHDVTVVVNERNLGYAIAMNQALAGTSAPALLALNPDTVPDPGSIETLLAASEAHPGSGVLVPRLLFPDRRPQPSAYRFPGPVVAIVASACPARWRGGRIGRRFLLEGSGPHADGPVDWAIGAVHLVRAEFLEGEQPYAERAFMYGEDLELCWRLAQRGHPTRVVADAAVVHVGNAAGAQAWGDRRAATYWRATYDVIGLRRSTGAARLMALGCVVGVAIAMLRIVATTVRGGDRSLARARIRGLAREARVHARVLVFGTPPPPTATPRTR